jgi:hypothetical protein
MRTLSYSLQYFTKFLNDVGASTGMYISLDLFIF